MCRAGTRAALLLAQDVCDFPHPGTELQHWDQNREERSSKGDLLEKTGRQDW